MALNIPENQEVVVQRAKTDVRRAWVGSNPFLKNSAIGALVIGYANRVYDLYLQLTEAIKQTFPDTATDEFLERWSSIFGVDRLAATKAVGNVAFSGVNGSSVPIGTVLTTSDGLLYETTSSGTIVTAGLSILTLTRIGSTATATCSNEHGLSDNVPVVINAVEPEYSGTHEISVTGEFTFTYQVEGSPATPSAAALGSATFDNIPVESNDFQDSSNGINVNLELGAILSLQSPLIGVDTEAGVDFNEIGGGTDQETDSSLRLRMLDEVQNPLAHFNVSDIISKAKEINGVTRVWVEETTPDVGQVTIYFMRDLDVDPFPDAGEITTTKDSILEIKPANTIDADVIVAAPVAVPTNFLFSALSPNTAAMQAAINSNLQQFFSEETDVSVTITEEKYIAAIQNTLDETGIGVDSFALSAPIGDIPITSGELGSLGVRTYP